MAGTPIINNVTGGLQDHCRFQTEDGEWIEFTSDFPSNHTGVVTQCGQWAKPVFPSNRSLQGSPMTPYIFDDRCKFEDVSEAIRYWYDMSREERKAAGRIGHAWMRSTESNMSARRMGARMIECINTCLSNWTPRKKYSVYKVEKSKQKEQVGIL
jgi:hypothetical protein